MPRTTPTLLAIALLAAAGSSVAQGKSQPAAPNAQTNPTVEMANVVFRYSPDVTVGIVRLRGTLVPTPGHSVPSFNDPNSFFVATDAAQMRMTTSQLTSLMNSWLLRSPKAQLKNIRITAEGNQLLIHGTMKKGLHIAFTSSATVSVAADNRIRISVQKVRAADLPVKGLMDALGLTVEDLISQKGLHGLSVDRDSFLIDPQTAFPPPQLRAKIAGVAISGQALVLSFGQGEPTLKPRPWKNYIALRGGSMEYGREEMFDSDLTMIDSTPADPFEFYLRQYWCQMVAGTIKVTPEKALRVYVPDYSKLPKSACRP